MRESTASGAEMGDEVVLTGKDREIVEVKVRIWYAGTVPGTFDMRLRLRDLSKSEVISGPAIMKDGKIAGYRNTPTPGAILYDGPMTTGLAVEPGMNEYVFNVPNVKVPTRFVWTIQGFSRKDLNGLFGPAYYDPPAVGSSLDYFWQSDSGSPWIAYSWGGGPVANFGVRIMAVSSKQTKPERVVPPR